MKLSYFEVKCRDITGDDHSVRLMAIDEQAARCSAMMSLEERGIYAKAFAVEQVERMES